jgi:hypothetical protein
VHAAQQAAQCMRAPCQLLLVLGLLGLHDAAHPPACTS